MFKFQNPLLNESDWKEGDEMAKFVAEYKCRRCGVVGEKPIPDYVQNRKDAIEYYTKQMVKEAMTFHHCEDGSLGACDFWGMKKVSD